MNKLFLFSTFLILSSSSIPISGNGQDCFWASSAGGWKFDGGKKVLSDKSGNTYTIGYLGNSDVVLNTDTLSHGWFAAKYNLSGDVQWTRQFIRGSGPDWGEEGLLSWQFDTIHNVLLLTGSFYQYLHLPDTLIHATGNGLFLIKMDMDGNVIWYKVFDGPGNDQAFGITYDSQGNIYISGSNEEQLIFSRDTLARGGFLAKFDADGNVLWAKNKFRFQGHSGSSYPYTEVDAVYMLYSNSSIIINGVAQNDTIIVDTATFINGNAYNSSFLASFNQQGDFQWMYLMGGPSGICGSSFAIDTNNNYYISGVIERKGYFGNDTLITPGLDMDCFLAKYSSSGQLIWVKSTQGSVMAWGFAVSSSKDGNIYYSGSFRGEVHFGETTLTSSPNSEDMFLAKYSPEGDFMGARQYHSGRILGICFDPDNNICFTGDYYDTLTFGTNTLYQHGQGDYFVAKCSPISSGIFSPQASENELIIYANPTSGISNITIPDDFLNERNLSLYIYDANGRLIQNVPILLNSSTIKFDIKARATGIYSATLTNGKKRYTGKIIFK